MTLEELIARYRTDANDKVNPYFCSDAEVTAWLNDAVNEACIRGRLIHESSNTTVVNIAVVAGTAVYSLHASLYELDHVAFLATGESCRKPIRLVSTEWLDDHVPDWRDRQCDPEYAVQTDRNIRLVPKPAKAGTLLLEGYRLPLTPMAANGAVPEINAEHHRHLVNWALHKGFSIPDSEFFDAKRADAANGAFSQYFGQRPDYDLRRKVREDEPQHVQAFMP